MDAPRPGHDQLMKELSGSASVRPSQIKKTAPPPVAPKPKVVSQRGPEIQMTSSYDDFPMPPPHHMLAADDLPPPPPPIAAEFSVAANGQVLLGGSGTMNGVGQQPASRTGSAAPAPMFTVKPFSPAGTTVTVTGGPRLGPRPFTPGGAGASSVQQPAADEGPAYPVKPPVQAAVDYPPPPPPLLSSGSAPAPPPSGMMPSATAARPAGSQPFTATLGARPSPAAPAHADVTPVASGGGTPLGQPRPFTSSTSITIGLGGSGPPAAGGSAGIVAGAKPFGSSAPSAAAAATASPKAPSAQASFGVQSPFGARAAEQPAAAGAKATIDLSFAASPGSAKDTGGGSVSLSKPSLVAAPTASAGNVTIRPFVQPPPPQQQQQQTPSPLSPAKAKTAPEAEVDSLTDLLLQNLEVAKDPTCLGICAHCNKKIATDSAMCTAMEKSYHIECFACCSCKKLLTGQSFYLMRNSPQCEACYTASLEKCNACQQPITDRILRATGKAYHARCFTCVVCHRSLDGVPFTVDSDNQVHCVEDFHKKYAPRCSVCQLPIMPEEGQEETVRIVALDRNFHINCYKCEDCGLLLSSEADGRGCYPLDGHVLCRSCNSKRVFEKTTGGYQQQQHPHDVPASDF